MATVQKLLGVFRDLITNAYIICLKLRVWTGLVFVITTKIEGPVSVLGLLCGKYARWCMLSVHVCEKDESGPVCQWQTCKAMWWKESQTYIRVLKVYIKSWFHPRKGSDFMSESFVYRRTCRFVKFFKPLRMDRNYIDTETLGLCVLCESLYQHNVYACTFWKVE